MEDQIKEPQELNEEQQAPVEILDREQKNARQRFIKQIRKAFVIFDPENRGAVPVEEIRFIVHTLELSPTEAQLNEFIQSICEDEMIEIQYEKLEASLLPILEQGKWPKASEELLLQAFKTIETTLNQMQADAEEDDEIEQKDEGGDAESRSSTASTNVRGPSMKKSKPAPPLTGYLSVEKLTELMTMHGEPFKQTELEDFLKNVPSEDGIVEYSKLATLLANE
ncbi:uncharacterized protein MONOS_862 [Monocercomonoides exilis]|uniref:uncharacterized protein n=1 Tax=Monocercomonoides exilis TaxID=2049356 RepID=UPI00355A44DF|nr:hypothetical protein MONOS_862 [Monocercomonoides exilis]|eukprot:MONOS_862.1-p1 / transcript=MONOS_862.1 / gene=MONOS_862 / organism=Monocercomonoides_exilis_PA203 / gene_product=unspecified product / transcript_product=unspecified product / location=Mono_scaffold00014:120979-121882(+) / protein_length=224 / sequence_SO=supercontig / SO=protein_coding / is_pseudo=false